MNYTRYAYGEAPAQTGIVYAATCKTTTALGEIVRLDLKNGTSTAITSYDGDRTVFFHHTGPDFAVWSARKTTGTKTETSLVFHDAHRGPPKSVDTKLLTPGASSGPPVRFAAYAGDGRAVVAWTAGYKMVQIAVLDVDSGNLVWTSPRIWSVNVDYVATKDRRRFLIHASSGDSELAPFILDDLATQPFATGFDTRLYGGLPYSWEGEWAFFGGKRMLMKHATEGWTLVDLDSQQRTTVGALRYAFPEARAAHDGSLAVPTGNAEQGFLQLVTPEGAASEPMPLGANTSQIEYVAPNAAFSLVSEKKAPNGTGTHKLLSFAAGRPPALLFEDPNVSSFRVEQSEDGPPFVIMQMYSPTRTLLASIGEAGTLGPITNLALSDVDVLDATHLFAKRCVTSLDGLPTDICLTADETFSDLKFGGRSLLGTSFGPNAPEPWTVPGGQVRRMIRYRIVNY